MSEEKQPWERREGEPKRWFLRFEIFRTLGPGRSLNAAVNQERASKSRAESRHAPGSWRNAARTWDWITRAQAWDKYLTDQAAAAQEAAWKCRIMGPSEVLARLSEEAQANPARFFIEREITIPGEHHKDGSVDPDMTIKSADLNWEEVRKNGHLIKSISFTQYGPKVELYSVQDALQLMGKHHGQFSERNLNIDLSKLTDEQLQRLAAGEDILHVLATPGPG